MPAFALLSVVIVRLLCCFLFRNTSTSSFINATFSLSGAMVVKGRVVADCSDMMQLFVTVLAMNEVILFNVKKGTCALKWYLVFY